MNYMKNNVQIIKTKCSDLKVVNAARVSMGKQHTEFDDKKDTRLINYLASHAHWTPFVHNRDAIIFPMSGKVEITHFQQMLALLEIENRTSINAQLITNNGIAHYVVKNSLYGWTQLLQQAYNGQIYMYDNHIERINSIIREKYPVAAKHLLTEKLRTELPVDSRYITLNTRLYDKLARQFDEKLFDITFYEKVPIFTARQRFKSMVCWDYNEVSRRYVDEAPTFYDFEAMWRSRPDGSIKQGSGDVSEHALEAEKLYQDVVKAAAAAYDKMVDKDGLNIAPEMARAILPQGMMTEYFATGNFVAVQRLLNQRLEEHAQEEIREFASRMLDTIKPIQQNMQHILNSQENVEAKLAELGVF